MCASNWLSVGEPDRKSPAVALAKCWNNLALLPATAVEYESLVVRVKRWSKAAEIGATSGACESLVVSEEDWRLVGGREGEIRLAGGGPVLRRLASLTAM